ncbi:oligosaccharide flippase family protein [Planctomicrobium piriforme]|uniref:Membrane protein involved in the export of O-antigen and teichoic acid n=1 Tax=Planctomicrobium piriforme TaxID=1576369 RepID=A0A1I3CAX9_9PLAN|nr:oligosaccharide flippase family protein [Planctomicrobium piriforme]SFH71593.1 Membrane protein involved in the export of O-antigen and teichoic acid [Planctomicrobium piriforme]
MTVRKNIIAGWMAHLVTVLIGFFMMPYILGTVGEAQYGAWVFINAVAGYSSMIYAGFGATICRYVADLSSRREWQKLNSVVSTIQLVYVGTASLVFAFTGLFAWWAPSLKHWAGLPLGEIQLSILIVGCTIGMGMIASVYGGVLVGTQRLDIKRGIEVTLGIVRLLLTLLCLHEHYGLVTLALIFFGVTVIEHGVSAWFAYRQLPQLSVAFWHARRDVFKECVGFSAFNAIALLAEYLIFFTDTIVIGFVLGPLAVVPYQIGLRIAQMIQIPISQIGEAVLPRAGELYARGQKWELAHLVNRGMGVAFLLSGGFLIGSIYFGELLIRTWIGPQFAGSQHVLVLLVASQLIALPMVVARKALLGIGQVKVQAWIDLLEAGINLVLSLIFIHYWGIIGVAWGTIIPLYVVELAVLLPYAARQLGLERRALWHTVVAPQLPAQVALILFCEYAVRVTPESGWLPLLAVTLGGGGVLLSVRWLMHLLERRSSVTTRPITGEVEALAGST